jgi:hypothetical protein
MKEKMYQHIQDKCSISGEIVSKMIISYRKKHKNGLTPMDKFYFSRIRKPLDCWTKCHEE